MQDLSLDRSSQKEKGYLVGLFMGDGYMGYTKSNRQYTVEFYLNSVKDKDIADYLISLLQSIGLNCLVFKDRRYNAIRIRVNSKEFMNWTSQKVSELRTSQELEKEYALGIISGFVDAEGYVKNGEILLTQKSKETLEIFRKILEPLNMAGKLWSGKSYKGHGDIWRMRISTRFKYLPHNSYKVNRVYSGAIP